MLQIKVDSNAVQQATVFAKLDALNLTDPLLDEAGAFFLQRIKTRFLAEVAPDDVPWIPSRAGLERRAHGGTGTLYDTGRLFHSIQLSTLDDTRIIGTDVPYGIKHQLGDPAHGIIRRMFLGFSDGDVDVVTKLLQKRLGDILSQTFGGGGT